MTPGQDKGAYIHADFIKISHSGFSESSFGVCVWESPEKEEDLSAYPEIY